MSAGRVSEKRVASVFISPLPLTSAGNSHAPPQRTSALLTCLMHTSVLRRVEKGRSAFHSCILHLFHSILRKDHQSRVSSIDSLGNYMPRR